MKLVKSMDAGPIYYQTTLNFSSSTTKDQIYQSLAKSGAIWLSNHLQNLPIPTPQDDNLATFTRKFTPEDSPLNPSTKTATELSNQIRAFSKYPKSKITINNLECIIIDAHANNETPQDRTYIINSKNPEHPKKPLFLALKCQNNTYLYLDQIQPSGRKIMDTKSFINGYLK